MAWFALIGDVVGSRRLDDRAAAQHRIEEVLAEVQSALAEQVAQRLEATVGDEFQGAFTTRAAATSAALLIRLALLPEIDVRCGIGYGEAEVFDADRRPTLQDGPAWWAARAALEELDRRPAARTWCADEAGANAYLLSRDALVDRLSDRGRRMLRLALLGSTQRHIAEVESISPSAVSQQFGRGVGAICEAERQFAQGG